MSFPTFNRLADTFNRTAEDLAEIRDASERRRVAEIDDTFRRGEVPPQNGTVVVDKVLNGNGGGGGSGNGGNGGTPRVSNATLAIVGVVVAVVIIGTVFAARGDAGGES